MVTNGQKRVKNGQKIVLKNGQNWSEIVKNGHKWSKKYKIKHKFFR